MTRIRLIMLAAVPMSALVFGITGCGGGSEDPGVATARTSGGASQSSGADTVRQAQKYANCLKDAGVTMKEGANGTLEVDKDKTGQKTILEASDKCRNLQPAAAATGTPHLSDDDIETRRQYASCIRQHGVKEYPDPDPQTGESVMDDDLARQLKSDSKFTPAVTACRNVLPSPTTSAVHGG